MVFVPGRVDCIFPGEYECRALHRTLGDEPDCDSCKNPRPLPEVLAAWEVAETLMSVQAVGLSEWALERFFPEIGEDTFRLAMRVVDIMYEKALKDAEKRRNK
ncbi:MAG: hypothetical protein WA666_02280 [Nitrospirota bacterium]